MDKFDTTAHARLVANFLMGIGILAWMIALADFLPDEIIDLPPHFFGRNGALAVGALLVFSGILMRRKH